MKSIASAPGKVILFGEHFVVYGVKAILTSINKRITVTSSDTRDVSITINSELGKITIPITKSYQDVKSTFRPFVYICQKMIQEHEFKGGINVEINSEIPSGVGLGSSSACCVAAAASISGLFTKYSRKEILELAISAEKTIFANTSGADCTVCTYGGILEYDKKNGFTNNDLKLNFHLVIANSKILHSTSKVVSKVNDYKNNNQEKFDSLCNNEANLIQNVNHALKNNDLKVLGTLMKQNQKFLEEIGISNETLRSMIEITNANSYGSKITGAGGGGCIIALVDNSNEKETIAAIKNKNYECFTVEADFKGLETF